MLVISKKKDDIFAILIWYRHFIPQFIAEISWQHLFKKISDRYSLDIVTILVISGIKKDVFTILIWYRHFIAATHLWYRNSSAIPQILNFFFFFTTFICITCCHIIKIKFWYFYTIKQDYIKIYYRTLTTSVCHRHRGCWDCGCKGFQILIREFFLRISCSCIGLLRYWEDIFKTCLMMILQVKMWVKNFFFFSFFFIIINQFFHSLFLHWSYHIMIEYD